MICDDRLRVVLLAPGCDGTDVGEPWSCYQWVRGVAEACDVTLLTLRRHDRPPVAEQLPGVEVVAWDELPCLWRFERFNSMLKPSYPKFYRRARHWLRSESDRGRRIDVVHQVGPLAMRYPCPATGLRLPTIIGPLAGSLTTPKAFRGECRGAHWFTRLRSLDHLRLQVDPWLRRSYESASAVVGVAPYVRELLGPMRIQRFELAGETGILDLPPADTHPPRTHGALKLLHVGRSVRTKGLRDLVRAMSHLADLPGVTLTVAGAGEDLPECRDEANRLGVADRIQFRGRIPRDEVEALYRSADVFAFPSFREPSGNVVFEAMRNGLPVITTDRGGPGHVVDADSGVTVPVESPEQLERALATTIRELATDPARVADLAAGARRRVVEVGLWSRKIERMLSLYRDVVRGDRDV